MSSFAPFTNQLIELPSGVSLEADLSLPHSTGNTGNIDSNTNPTKLAICLHPWSWLGGNKDDPTLRSLHKPLEQHGYCVIRYNSRGVGRSTGRASFTGLSEAQDLRDLVQWGINTWPDLRTVVIIGYSYGSFITSLHPVLPPPIHISHVLLSYPLGPRGWLTGFKTSTYSTALTELIQNPASNVLVIYGDRDEFTGVSKYDEWVEGLQRDAAGDGRGQLQVAKIPEGTHFWAYGPKEELREVLARWLP